jgi:hypothetical protein
MATPRPESNDAVVRFATLVLVTNGIALTFVILMVLVFFTSTAAH